MEAAASTSSLYISRRIMDDIKYSRNADIKRHAVYAEERALTLPIEEALIYAIQMINCEAVNRLIELCGRARINFRYTDSRGRRFIHHAAESGSASLLRIFLPTGPLNVQDADGWTPLLRAADRGHTQVIEILSQESSVNMPKTPKPEQMSALHLAVRGRHCDCVDALLARGACPDMLADSGETPLHLAVESACLHCVLAVLERGANPQCVDVYGQTPLHLAAKRDNAAVADCLLNAGADPCAKDTSGRSPLHQAILNDRWAMANYLLALPGIDVNACDHQGVRPLHLAIIRCAGSAGMLPMASTSAAESSALAAAPGQAVDVLATRIELLEKLLARGADVNALTEEAGESPISLAVTSGSETLVRLLLANGASVSAADKNGASPLHRANMLASFSRNVILAALIDSGCDVNALDKFGYSPLSKCVFQLMVDRISQADCFEGLRLMVRAGATLGPTNWQQAQLQQVQAGQTRQMNSPIVFLAWRGHWPGVIFLIRCGWRLREDANLLPVLAASATSSVLPPDPTRDRLARWVETVWLRRPPCLAHLCRGVVRDQLGGVMAETRIQQLPIPARLRSYLLYEPECRAFEDTSTVGDDDFDDEEVAESSA